MEYQILMTDKLNNCITNIQKRKNLLEELIRAREDAEQLQKNWNKLRVKMNKEAGKRKD